ncbi:HAD-like domain-containing protein [Xylariaceae sp. FL0255]|nr:HAD-like domain-containing protein [Xylariaceae sp. FL0255]
MHTSRTASRALSCLSRPHLRDQSCAAPLLATCSTARWKSRKIPSLTPLVSSSRSYSQDIEKKKEIPPFAFAFDIDGVLLHVAKPIPGATQTLRYLQEREIPFIFLTNGGGKHEEERVAGLSEALGVELTTDNFVQSHTPFKQLVHGNWESQPDAMQLKFPHGLADHNILVTGSDPEKCRRIAEAYGFRKVITPADILVANPTVFPFDPLRMEYYQSTARPLPNPNPKIEAIFVFNDPRDWALDIQIIIDLLLAKNGVLGTYSARNKNRATSDRDGQPRLYFSNPDMFWSANYHLPRLGQGAFERAIFGIWHKITRGSTGPLRTIIGKPYSRTYQYADQVLLSSRAKMFGIDREKEDQKKGGSAHLRRVYMVGDNPASDIAGANAHRKTNPDARWHSILVKTGVWDKERDGLPHSSEHPDVIVEDVQQALDWALNEEKLLQRKLGDKYWRQVPDEA